LLEDLLDSYNKWKKVFIVLSVRLLKWCNFLIQHVRGFCHVLKYQLPNVYESVEIQMFIMSKYSTFPHCYIFDCCNDIRYIDIFVSVTCSQAVIAQSVRRRIFVLEVRGLYPVGARTFAFLLCFLFFVHSNVLVYYYATFYHLT
jgi:hypothetical protein